MNCYCRLSTCGSCIEARISSSEIRPKSIGPCCGARACVHCRLHALLHAWMQLFHVCATERCRIPLSTKEQRLRLLVLLLLPAHVLQKSHGRIGIMYTWLLRLLYCRQTMWKQHYKALLVYPMELHALRKPLALKKPYLNAEP